MKYEIWLSGVVEPVIVEADSVVHVKKRITFYRGRWWQIPKVVASFTGWEWFREKPEYDEIRDSEGRVVSKIWNAANHS